MTKTKINATIVADSVNQFGNRITTMLVTFPRYILAELNTHRMFSKNSASSRAIPFAKMIKAVEDDPFIPIAWMKDHKGMQGTEYFNSNDSLWDGDDDKDARKVLLNKWVKASEKAIEYAKSLNEDGLTKQMVNRILEPYMWHTVLITATEWENFFYLRCPKYATYGQEQKFYRSRKDFKLAYKENNGNCDNADESFWLERNKGQADIHMMALAEAMWDAYNESTPKQLKGGEWHIPFGDNIDGQSFVDLGIAPSDLYEDELKGTEDDSYTTHLKVKVATARCARTSYTVIGKTITPTEIKVGDWYQCCGYEMPFELVKAIEHDAGVKGGQCEINGLFVNYEDIVEVRRYKDYQEDIALHDRLAVSGHWSPFEHCARVMNNEEYETNINGKCFKHSVDYAGDNHLIADSDTPTKGWSGNFRGFIQYRKMFDNENITK